MNTHDVTKLPRWAQNEISRLKANEAAAKSRLSVALGEEESPLKLHLTYGHEVGISPSASLLYKTEGRKILEVRVSQQYPDQIEVRSSGGIGLSVSPIAGNVVRIGVTPH